jgi:molybdopterin-guanine dinucleotide biosynthesis protein
MPDNKCNKQIKLDGMLLIGSTGRKSGKTSLACQIIQKFRKNNLVAIKVTTVTKTNKNSHSDLSVAETKGFIITEETRNNTDKDTSKMLAAGASRVFWLCAEKKCLKSGLDALLKKIGNKKICICESNSLRQFVEPGLFIMVKGPDCRKTKPSAKHVINFADRIVTNRSNDFDNLLKDLRLAGKKWLIIKQKKDHRL